MVEYDIMSPEHYDGISEIQCNNCGIRIGRWSGNELKNGELERISERNKNIHEN